ncbi:MAG: TraR/DksA family transcriptional regulator [bacterium]
MTDDKIKEQLLSLKAELERQSDDSAQARATVELDQQSVGRLSRQDALQQQAMANAQHQLRHRQVLRIDAALLRLEQGNYGLCLNCGEDIAPKRLAIDPAVELCIDCKS